MTFNNAEELEIFIEKYIQILSETFGMTGFLFVGTMGDKVVTAVCKTDGSPLPDALTELLDLVDARIKRQPK